jgi:hypothetical protein
MPTNAAVTAHQEDDRTPEVDFEISQLNQEQWQLDNFLASRCEEADKMSNCHCKYTRDTIVDGVSKNSTPDC